MRLDSFANWTDHSKVPVFVKHQNAKIRSHYLRFLVE